MRDNDGDALPDQRQVTYDADMTRNSASNIRNDEEDIPEDS